MNKQAENFMELLSKSTSVGDWNETMCILNRNGLTSAMRGYIESSGLIVKTLGTDNGQPKISNNENW